jgi:hypothetical protein
MRNQVLIVVLLAIVVLMAGVMPVFAREGTHDTAGAKIDAPNLIRFTDNLTLGAELSKDIAKNVFYPDTFSMIEDDRGFAGYVKLTYTGTLFSFKK